MAGIVVGIDGSPISQRALDWAAREAALRQAPLTVLAVHQVAVSNLTGRAMTAPEDAPDVEAARQAAQELTVKTTSQLDSQPLSITVRAVSGLPARELVDASQDADLVVVGSRGAGGFAALLLGSVSSQVVAHAACPVVVIRHTRP
jgi:nucleotide-binding universal stress UspA family protein